MLIACEIGMCNGEYFFIHPTIYMSRAANYFFSISGADAEAVHAYKYVLVVRFSPLRNSIRISLHISFINHNDKNKTGLSIRFKFNFTLRKDKLYALSVVYYSKLFLCVHRLKISIVHGLRQPKKDISL